jgi:mRNA-degrading endonuclease toxin of MazEF toxin-antitoxin module
VAPRALSRGQIWLLERSAPDHRRPVLVVSDDRLLALLHTATVVAITSTLRGAPTEVELGVDEGLKHTSCANAVNVFTVSKADLRTFVGTVPPDKLERVCRALGLALGCPTAEP